MKERKNSSNKKKIIENNLSWERYNEWSVLLFQWILSSEEMKWMQKQNEGKIRNTYPSLEPRENVKWSLSNLASTINDAHCGFDRKLINTELKWNNCENDFQIYISNDSKNFNSGCWFCFSKLCGKENLSGNEFDVPKIVEFWSELVHIWQSTNGLPFKTGFHIESDMSAKTVV